METPELVQGPTEPITPIISTAVPLCVNAMASFPSKLSAGVPRLVPIPLEPASSAFVCDTLYTSRSAIVPSKPMVTGVELPS